jgi:hypothetical protein
MGAGRGRPLLYKYLLNCCDDRAKKPLLAPQLNLLCSTSSMYLTGQAPVKFAALQSYGFFNRVNPG